MSEPNRLSTQVNRGVAWAGASQAIIAVADLISHAVVIALWVSAGDYGLAMIALPLYTMLDTAADLGVTSALIQRDDHTPERVSTVFWVNMIASSILFVALLGLGPLYGWFQGEPVVGWLLIAYGAKLLFQNVYAIPFALLKKELRFGEIAMMRAAAHVAESIARIGFAWAGYTVWCFTLAPLTRTLVFGVLMQWRNPFIPKLVFRWHEVRDYIRFGVRAAASQVLYQLYVNLDYAVVSYYFGKTANGIYALAYQIVLEPVRTITNVVNDVAFPAFARIRFDRDKLIDQFISFTRLNLLGVLPFLVVIALVVPELLAVAFDKEWTDAQLEVTADCTRVLCWVGILRALGFLGPPLLDALGRPHLTLRYMVVAAILVPGSFVLFAVLFPDLGPLSVALAWAIAYPLAFLLLAYLVKVSLKLPLGRYARATWGIVACVAIGFVVGVAAHQLTDHMGPGVRLAVTSGSSLGTMALLLAYWQDIHPRSMMRALK
jgi:teichuronic acid exporter